MSDIVIEEPVKVVPWLGSTSYDNSFSIVVISKNIQIIECINEALLEVHSKGNHSWKLLTFPCTDLSEIKGYAIDFVVIAIDTNDHTSVNWAKTILELVHPDLARRRIVLVNARGVCSYDMGIDAEELLELQDEKHLDLLSANVLKCKEVHILARRLLTYLEVFHGVNTGIPNFNI